jgi:hypothetical protein
MERLIFRSRACEAMLVPKRPAVLTFSYDIQMTARIAVVETGQFGDCISYCPVPRGRTAHLPGVKAFAEVLVAQSDLNRPTDRSLTRAAR